MNEMILSTDKGPVLIPANLELAALAVALSYCGGLLRWNIRRRRLEVVSLFPRSRS